MSGGNLWKTGLLVFFGLLKLFFRILSLFGIIIQLQCESYSTQIHTPECSHVSEGSVTSLCPTRNEYFHHHVRPWAQNTFFSLLVPFCWCSNSPKITFYPTLLWNSSIQTSQPDLFPQTAFFIEAIICVYMSLGHAQVSNNNSWRC